MNPTSFQSLYDVPCSDLGVVADQLDATRDPETLRRLAVGLWLDVYLLQLSLDVLRAAYAGLVDAAREAVAANTAATLDELRRHVAIAIDDPDLPVGYALTDTAQAAVGRTAGRPV